MIQSIHIIGFQSHKDTALSLHPGVNVVIGRSDSGKSAILRALLWVVTNRPSGESFRSRWGGDTQVSVELDGGSLFRRRGKGENCYCVKAKDGRGQTYDAIRTDVPAEVDKLLNLSDVNVQRQLDAPFLLSETAGEVARQLNSIANLEIIDTATANIARTIRRHGEEVKAQEAELIRVVNEMRPYADLPEQEKLLEEAEATDRTLLDLKAVKTGLEFTLRDIATEQEKLCEAGDVAAMEKLWGQIEYLGEGIGIKNRMVLEVNAIVAEIEIRERELAGLEERAGAETDFVIISKMIQEREQRSQTSGKLIGMISVIENRGMQASKAGMELRRLEDSFKKLMPDVCPLCRRPGARK